MSINLYMDENVPLPVTEGLRRRDVDVLRVQDDGRKGTPDNIVLDRAAELQRVVFNPRRGFFSHRQPPPARRSEFCWRHLRSPTKCNCWRFDS